MAKNSARANTRFSVVIPAYNEAEFIGDTLRSLAQQDFEGEVEVIVADNKSDDETVKIAMKMGARVVEESNSGVCWARQRGTESARGEIVISTDADTVFDPNWLSRIDSAFRQDNDVVAVAGPCHYVDGPWWGRIYPRILFGAVAAAWKLTGRTYYVTATNLAFLRTAWPGYNTHLTQGGDELDLLRRLRQRGEVRFDRGLVTHTSGRRLERGLIYNFVVSLLLYYFLEYSLSRLVNRPVFGSAPAIRSHLGNSSLLNARVAMAVLLAGALSLLTPMGHFLLHFGQLHLHGMRPHGF